MNRIEYIDAIKGFAILLMVIGHVIASCFENYGEVVFYEFSQPINVKMGGVIWQIIYSFHMPLFFMVSGFLTYKAFEWGAFTQFLLRRSIRLLLPWVCTSWIFYLLRGNVGYWFLLCLFEISLFSFVLICLMEKINRKKIIWVDIAIVAAVYILMRRFHVYNFSYGPLELDRVVSAYLPFMFGVLMRKYNALFNLCVRKSWVYSCLIIGSALFFCSRYLLDCGIMFHFLKKYAGLVLPLSLSLVVIHLFANGYFAKLEGLFSYIGKRSLPIYIIHFFFIMRLPAVGSFILQQNAVTAITIQLVYTTIQAGIAIIISLAIYKVMAASPHIRLLFFGER